MNEYPFCQKILHPITRKETYRAGLIILTNHFYPHEQKCTYPAFGIGGYRYSKVYTGEQCVTYCETHKLYPLLVKYISDNNYKLLEETFDKPLTNTKYISIFPLSETPQVITQLRHKYKMFRYNRKKNKMSDNKIWAIRYQIATGKPIKYIANDFHLNRKNIQEILNYHFVPLCEVTEEWFTWYYSKKIKEDVTFDKNQKFKRLKKRKANISEIEYIFKKTLEGWKPIKIYNVMLQENPSSNINKEWVNNISKGTVRILKHETNENKYNELIKLKQQVFELYKNNNLKS